MNERANEWMSEWKNGWMNERLMLMCECECDRYANLGGLGFQEKLVLQNKARDALERGEQPDDMPGMDQAMKDMDAKKV